MKKYIKMFIIAAVMAFFSSCTSTPNQDKGQPNSTGSGSHASGNSDGSNLKDTLNPAQPNGMDTSGEQTGRMNNPSSGSSRQKKADTAGKK